MKPVDPDYLAASVRRALDTVRLRREVERQHAALRRHADELERAVELRTRELSEANRTKDAFLATVSHELLTPLTAILGWARLLWRLKVSGVKSSRVMLFGVLRRYQGTALGAAMSLMLLQQLRSQAYTAAGATSAYYRPQVCPTEYVPTAGYKAAAFACGEAGKPYVWGAAGPDVYDCSGLTMVAWQQVGVYLPHNAWEQWRFASVVAREPRSRAWKTGQADAASPRSPPC